MNFHSGFVVKCLMLQFHMYRQAAPEARTSLYMLSRTSEVTEMQHMLAPLLPCCSAQIQMLPTLPHLIPVSISDREACRSTELNVISEKIKVRQIGEMLRSQE